MPTFTTDSAALDVDIRNSWSGGLVADFTLTPQQAVTGWTVEFEYDGDIVDLWNARVVSQVGNRYVVENLGYNSTIGAGGTAGFGFVGNGPSNEITPVAINGDAIGDGANPDPVPLPTVSVFDATATEEDGTLSFQLTLSAPSNTDVVVSYQTIAGSANAGADFSPAQAQVTIPAGQLSANVTIALIDDADPESAETFQVELTGAVGAEIADATATGEITDSDMAAPVDPDPMDPPADDGGADSGANGGGSYELSLDDWGSGFVARFNFTPDTAVSGGWVARIATTANVTNVWNGDIVSHENGVLTIQNASWNGSIAAGQTIEVGFQGSGSSTGLALIDTTLPISGVASPPVDPDPVDPDPIDPDPVDPPADGGNG
ncbi:MAG: cellulose binding domain-containing protein, partial [Pseudomonadota bacterium]